MKKPTQWYIYRRSAFQKKWKLHLHPLRLAMYEAEQMSMSMDFCFQTENSGNEI